MFKFLFFACLLIWALDLARSEDAWFSAQYPSNGKTYPVTARINTQEQGDSIKFSYEMWYRAVDTSFSMHSVGTYNTKNNVPIWQNTVRNGLYSVEWSFKDYREKPAAVYWQSEQSDGTITFENEAVPEEFLYFLTEKIDSVNSNKEFKMLSPALEVSFKPDAWITNARYTGKRFRIQGVDCYQVIYTRSDNKKAEYYVTEKGKQIWRFQTFRGMWFDRVQ